MDKLLYIVVSVLVTILCLAQIGLAIHQLKKKQPDGKILLLINIIVLVIWIPLNILKYVVFAEHYSLPVSIAWFLVAGTYMIFAFWYTNKLGKTKK